MTTKLGELPPEFEGEFTTLLTNRRGLVMPPRDAQRHPDGIRVGLEALRPPAGQPGAANAILDDNPWPIERWLHRDVVVLAGWID
jgi:hypothetical protein